MSMPLPEWTNLNSYHSIRQKEVHQEKLLVLETSESIIKSIHSAGQNSDQVGHCLLPLLRSVFFLAQFYNKLSFYAMLHSLYWM